MAEHPRRVHGTIGLDTPLSARRRRLPRLSPNPDSFGETTEGFARFMGTPQFLLWMTLFCLIWVGWNSWGPEDLRFDSAALGFTALTLMLSLQASYAAPLLLLAQNRQDDRDKVSLREDRDRAERNLADTEYLTREIAGLRIALQDVSTRDFIRSELRGVHEDLVAELRESLRAELREELQAAAGASSAHDDGGPDESHRPGKGSAKKAKKKLAREAGPRAADGAEPAAQTTTLAIIAAQEAQTGLAPDRSPGAESEDARQDRAPRDPRDGEAGPR